jgi:hypothetical protein
MDLVEYPLRSSTSLVNLGPDPPFWWIRSMVELVEVEVFGQKKVDLDLVLVNLELVNVYQIGPTSHLHIGVYQAHCVVH